VLSARGEVRKSGARCTVLGHIGIRSGGAITFCLSREMVDEYVEVMRHLRIDDARVNRIYPINLSC